MSSPIWSAGISSTETVVGGASSAKVGADDHVGRQQHLHPAVPRGAHEVADGVDLVGLDARGSDLVPVGDEERERHRAADGDRVDPLEQVLEHGQLVGDLRAAEHRHVGPDGIGQQAAEHLELALEELAGVPGQAGRDPGDRRVRTVGRPERVVDVDVRERRERVREAVVVGGLARVEAQVLEQQDLTGLERLGLGAGVVADDVGRDEHLTPEQVGEHRRDRRHRGRRVGRTLRPPEVGGDHHGRPLVEQVLDRRHRGPDAQVVGDLDRPAGGR
jgi:hypothetical protein